jgi:hypothetical protein
MPRQGAPAGRPFFHPYPVFVFCQENMLHLSIAFSQAASQASVK